MASIILTDIEGTTSSLSFVKDVLFPYAEKHLPDFVRQNQHKPEVKAALDEIGGTVEEAIATLLQWIAEDKKATPLKSLQGMVWQQGYERGELTADVYPDALAALKEWQASGRRLYIYSSGSVQAQKLLFGHTEEGNLNPLFSGYFDTTIGGKLEKDSYTRIVEEIGAAANDILFLSDNIKELDAARDAGMGTVWLNRYQMPDRPVHKEAKDFSEIAV